VGGGLTSGARWQAGGGRAGLDSGERTGPGLLSARGWLGRSGGVSRSWAEGVEAGRAGLGSGPRGSGALAAEGWRAGWAEVGRTRERLGWAGLGREVGCGLGFVLGFLFSPSLFYF